MRYGFLDEITSNGRKVVATGPYSEMLAAFRAGSDNGKALLLSCTDRSAKMTKAAAVALRGGSSEPEIKTAGRPKSK